MKKTVIILILLSIVVILVTMQMSKKDDKIQNCFCADSTNELCKILPESVFLPDSIKNKFSIDHGLGYVPIMDSILQPYFDIYSWQVFVALNWPSDSTKDITDVKSLRVWEMFPDPDTIFTNKYSIKDVKLANGKSITISSNFSDPKSDRLSGFEQSDGNSLIDRNLNYVIFEERINKIESDYIHYNGLGTKEGQEKFTGSIELPIGSIEIKASWRILDPKKDDVSSFYHQPATIYIESGRTVDGKDLTINVEIGLVGLHILSRSDNGTFGTAMIWSTFEHIDNTPDNLQEAQSPLNNRKYSFYNQNCIGCKVNTPPLPNSNMINKFKDSLTRWSPTPPYAIEYAYDVKSENNSELGNKSHLFGTQVVRSTPIFYYTQELNKIWREKLKGTVWANYQLIGTQWGSKETTPVESAPMTLGNTTMETYIQGTSDCITCHNSATLADSSNTPSDFSFLFYHVANNKSRFRNR